MRIFTPMQSYLTFLRNLVPSNRELLLNGTEIDTSEYFEILKTNIKSAALFQNRGENFLIPL
jgi:hypothetical protein